MAKKISSKEKQDQNLINSTISAETIYTKEIVSAFSKKMDIQDFDFFSLPKDELVAKFEEFVRDEYDNNVLEALREGKIGGKSLDIEFNAIANKGFTLYDFIQTKKGDVIKQHLSRTTTEPQAIQSGLLALHQRWISLPDSIKNKLKLADFISSLGYRSVTNPSGEIIQILPGNNPKSLNIQKLQRLWKEYLRSEITDVDQIKDYTSMLNFDHFDPTQKVVAVSSVHELYEKIKRTTKGSQSKNLLDLADQVFAYDKDGLFSDLSWITMEGLQIAMKDFFHQASAILGEKEMQSLQNIRVTLQDCVKIGEENNIIPQNTLDKKLFHNKYSQLNRQFQYMANDFVQADLINNIDTTLENIDSEIDQYAQIFDIPGNMAAFFDKFGTPGGLKNTGGDAQYIQLKKQEYDLKEELSQQPLSLEDKNAYEAELILLQGKITDYKDKNHATTWQEYFTHIAQQVDSAQWLLGTSLSGAEVSSVLQGLKDKNWDVSQLGDQQNILMQASLAMELMKLKENKSFETLGYSFNSYAQFVTSLYDLKNMKATIMTQDKIPIDLNFTSKKFVGKPLEFHNIDISNISDLSQIRVEFELDLNDNPQAESFLRMMTGGPSSQLIKDFLPNHPGFPATITDSTLVEMIDHNGISYEGYLSPTDLTIMESTDESPYSNYEPQDQVSTFLLYSKPADQLHTDRDLIVHEEIPSDDEKAKPIYINAANAKDRKSIKILDKKATLSDGQLKALSLGHMAAQSIYSYELSDPKNPPQIQELLDQLDASAINKLKQNTLDISTEDELVEELEYEKLTLPEEFQKSWKEMVGDYPCEEGTRMAVQYPQIVDGISIVQTHPKSEQLLSLTVKKINKDNQGNIIGCTFGVNNLSRIGHCNINDISLDGNNLDKIGEVFLGGVTYIDNINKDPQDYKTVLTRLQSQFSDGPRKRAYIWDNLKQFGFDGKKFLKGKEEITHFIANEKTSNADKNDIKQYQVEYKIEKLLGGKYRITSSPYSADIPDGKGKTTAKNISFDTTTDLTGMLLILANKNLLGYTDTEYEETQKIGTAGSDTIPHKPTQRYSIATIWRVLSGKGKDIVAALKKKLGENQEEELRFTLFTEGKLLRRVSNSWLGKSLGAFDLNVFDDMAGEAESSGQEYGWNKINAVFEHLSKFHAAYNANADSGMAMVSGIIQPAIASYNTTQNLPLKQRWKVAGALLYSIDKMKSGYARDLAKEPVGTYVKLLFGPEYYSLFMKRYKDLELKSKMNNEEGKDALEQLSLLEYNYIVDNTRGGATLEKDPPPFGNPFYFQGIYSRTFGNKLGERLSTLKSFNMAASSDDIQALIKTNNFHHVYRECKTHIGHMRIDDALKELIALQSMAKTPDQADDVDKLFMAGILTGVFTNNLSKTNKTDLNKAMRNSSIPYAKLIELHDAPERLQALLSLATGNGPGDFSNFKYGKNGKNYNSQDFRAYVENQDKEGLVESFTKRFDDNRGQVISFLHMDPQSMQTDNNLIRVRKSQDTNLTIFGKKVDPTTKMYVNDMMNDFYFNRSRSVGIENLNFNSGLEHTSSMIENFFPIINKYRDGSRETDNLDHADLIWGNISNTSPSGKENQKDKYRLSWNVNNFFKMFQGIGSIAYNRTEIEMFYRYMSLAKNSSLSIYDRNRLIWFHLTQKLYANGPVPDVVKKTFVKYMKYFEDNLENMDKELGQTHEVPSGGEHFGYIFEENNPFVYIPSGEWRAKDQREQMYEIKSAQSDGKLIINKSMSDFNQSAISGGRGGSMNSKAIGRTIDDEIVSLRGGKVVIEPKNIVRRGQAVDINNRDKIDLSDIVGQVNEKPSDKQSTQQGSRSGRKRSESDSEFSDRISMIESQLYDNF